MCTVAELAAAGKPRPQAMPMSACCGLLHVYLLWGAGSAGVITLVWGCQRCQQQPRILNGRPRQCARAARVRALQAGAVVARGGVPHCQQGVWARVGGGQQAPGRIQGHTGDVPCVALRVVGWW